MCAYECAVFHRTRLSLTGTMIVARDIAHAKLQERIDQGHGLPEYIKNHIVYYGATWHCSAVHPLSLCGRGLPQRS